MTLKQFLETEVAAVENPIANVYEFEYKDCNCFASYQDFGNAGATLYIRPRNSRADIGAGAGMGLLINLQPEPKTSELLDTVEKFTAMLKDDARRGSNSVYHIMWNERESIGEVLTRLIAEERKKLSNF